MLGLGFISYSLYERIGSAQLTAQYSGQLTREKEAHPVLCPVGKKSEQKPLTHPWSCVFIKALDHLINVSLNPICSSVCCKKSTRSNALSASELRPIDELFLFCATIWRFRALRTLSLPCLFDQDSQVFSYIFTFSLQWWQWGFWGQHKRRLMGR